MTEEEKEKREEAIRNIANLLENNPFTFELHVKKNPKGIRVIYEITQETKDAFLKMKTAN